MKLEYMQFSKFYLLSIIFKIHPNHTFKNHIFQCSVGVYLGSLIRQSQLFDFLVFKCVIRVYDKTLGKRQNFESCICKSFIHWQNLERQIQELKIRSENICREKSGASIEQRLILQKLSIL